MEFNIVRIESLCKEREEELLEAYFGNLVEEAAQLRPEFIGKYTPDLPFKIESEYKDFLNTLVKQLFPDTESLTADNFLEEKKLRELITDDDREAIAQAYKKASKRTVMEWISKTNHKDVTFYKGLLEAHAKDLLLVMRTDFLEELTGKYIRNKTFEEE